MREREEGLSRRLPRVPAGSPQNEYALHVRDTVGQLSISNPFKNKYTPANPRFVKTEVTPDKTCHNLEYSFGLGKMV